MTRTAPLKAIAKVMMSSLLFGSIALTKAAADQMKPAREKLKALQSCMGQEDRVMAFLSRGLLHGWTGHVTPPPAEYLESLGRDLRACEAAGKMEDPEQRRLVLDSVHKDIQIKARDCRTFGMGRMVPVSIVTKHGSKVENGWQVFYKWSCASPLQPQELTVHNFTSPANAQLPPGEYTFRAEKRNSTGQIETIPPITITVGDLISVPLELAVQ
jgi:hypothetical protein